ncbi:hypothetical protein GOD93_16380 [Sinorhizobium medicae]|nr:hypothetical protein [Sinorhizobium medicae]
MTNVADDIQTKLDSLQHEIDSLFMLQRIYRSGLSESAFTVNPDFIGFENVKLRVLDLIQGNPMDDRVWFGSREMHKKAKQMVAEYEREQKSA